MAIFFTIGNTLQKSGDPNSDRIPQVMDRIRKDRTGPKNSSCNKLNNGITQIQEKSDPDRMFCLHNPKSSDIIDS